MQSECPPAPPRVRRVPSLGALGHWVGANTLTPPWLPARWRHPLVGYLAAVLLQVVAVAGVAVLALVSHGIASPTLLSLLAVALVALTWGAGPSLLATLAGTALLGALLRSPALHIAESEAGRWEVQGLFLVVGGCLGALASRVARERRDARDQAAQRPAVFAASADGLAVFDAAGRLVRGNAALRALSGLDARPDAFAPPLGERVDLFVTRDEEGRPLPPAAWPLARVLQGETLAPPLDLTIRALDGRTALVNVSGAPLRDAAGRPSGAVLGVRDVTEQRHLEREVAAERARLREMIDVAPAAVALLTGPEHTVAVANPTYGRVAGRPGALAGRAFRDTFPALADQGVVALLDEAYRTGTPVARTEMRVRYDRDGDGAPEDTYFNFVFQPLRDASGTVEGVLIHGVEVTVQVEARRRVEDLAVERDRARSAFVATVSHELRTPLTSIRAGLGFLERAVGDQFGPDEGDLFDAVGRNVERLRRHVDDLLLANRLDAGALHPVRVPLDLAAVARTALAEVRALLDEKGQAVALNLPTPLPVAGDARLLGQVVANLLSNVYRHTPAGTRVTLAGWVARIDGDGDGDEVRLCVGDDGPGLPPAEVDAIFGRFHRADAAAGGSGLGLSIAREIVALHGGRLWAENAEEGGAVFHVALPHDAADAAPEGGAQPATRGQDERVDP